MCKIVWEKIFLLDWKKNYNYLKLSLVFMGEYLSYFLDFDYLNVVNKIIFEFGWFNLFKFGLLRFGVKW